MISNFPWLLVAVILYNVIAFSLGIDPTPDATGRITTAFDDPLMSFTMISGAVWQLTLGDLMIILTLAFLFVELIKATRTSSYSIVDHALSMVVFIICIVEFLAVRQAATSVFFVIIVVVLIDVIAGFTITIRAAKRDVAFGPGADGH
ncbi:MAG: hypothetical protein NW215_00740 [Hyphomicrobiales bacterium]|nr:hypothetical protein [Hyphomicrobiales bacterium]